MPNTPNWLTDEESHADAMATAQQTPNAQAPRLVRVYRKPARRQKPIYIQDAYRAAIEPLIFDQKKVKGPTGPELFEEAIDMLLAKYGYPPVES